MVYPSFFPLISGGSIISGLALLCKAEEEAQLTLGRDIIKIRGPCRRRGARLDRI
ncbi:hypothetical protein HMPREF0239_04405 [Clostridium sp. ATCC BAA-442]|uniref:Uncharacterized protein n=1 Tax=Flavonifractor plautii ATCC 29863 TaxID=411475 RepID=G9YPJ5_FLAPL|nr:hypothetical protein HMPREF0372_01431 [Flavonifractor plautii ATCC 29863]ERI64487.1 hypothetical protein HMPREF0239_04405 [Clostridium sp. ATCC BAA-442]